MFRIEDTRNNIPETPTYIEMNTTYSIYISIFFIHQLLFNSFSHKKKQYKYSD